MSQGISITASESASALTAAIEAEVSAHDTAVANESRDRIADVQSVRDILAVVNGDSTTVGSFRKEFSDLIGGAPAALDTLKEIADYIAVNPDANVMDAINAAVSRAIALGSQAVADLTRTFLGHVDLTKALFADSAAIVVGQQTATFEENIGTDGLARFTLQWGEKIAMVLNFGNMRYVTSCVSFDVPVIVEEHWVNGLVEQTYFADFSLIAEQVSAMSGEGAGIAGTTGLIQFTRKFESFDRLMNWWD